VFKFTKTISFLEMQTQEIFSYLSTQSMSLDHKQVFFFSYSFFGACIQSLA